VLGILTHLLGTAGRCSSKMVLAGLPERVHTQRHKWQWAEMQEGAQVDSDDGRRACVEARSDDGDGALFRQCDVACGWRTRGVAAETARLQRLRATTTKATIAMLLMMMAMLATTGSGSNGTRRVEGGQASPIKDRQASLKCGEAVR
jgi:hypothetical protein